MKNLRLALMAGGLLAASALLMFSSELRTWWNDKEHFESDQALVEKLKGEALATAAPAAATDDWSQWRGPNRDGIGSEKDLLTSWPSSGPPVLWKVPGGIGYSSISIAGDRLVTLIQDGDDEVVLCLALADGAVKWKHRYPARFHEALGGVGPRSTPAIADGRVYAVGATGLFHCLDAGTGKVEWMHDFCKEMEAPLPEYGFTTSPLVLGDRVYVTIGGAKGGCCAAYNRTDGKLLWKSQEGPSGYSSPIAATLAGRAQIVFLTGDAVLGLEPADGKQLWRYPWVTQQGINAATPVVIGSNVLVSSGYGKGCGLLNIAATGDTFTATRVYEHNRMRNHFATSVLVGDHVYGFDDAYLIAMEALSGKVKWKQRGFDKGSLIAIGKRLIVLGEHGKLALVEANPQKYQEVSNFPLTNSRCWGAPALAQGKLLVRDQESVFCVDLRQNPVARGAE